MTTRTTHDVDPEDTEVARRDSIVDSYRTILNELGLLTTVSVLLFGFLLSALPSEDSGLELWIYGGATVLVASATLVFVLPVAYHHIQYPYEDFEKFQARSHFWVMMGLPLLGGGLYLGLSLALWNLFEGMSFVVAGVPIVVTGVVFAVRKGF
jgi:hypothetical protein